MNSGIKNRLEPTYLTKSSGKWLVVVKKTQKDQTQRAIYTVINETLFPYSQVERSGRSNKHNINFSLVTNTASI